MTFVAFLSCNIYCAVSLLRILKALKISLLKKIQIFLLPWMAYYNLILYFNQLIIRLLVIKLIFPVIIRVLCTFFYLTNINNSQTPYRNICENMRKIMRLDLQYTKRLVLLNENLPLRFKSDLQVLSETIMSPNLQKSVLSTNGSI